MALTNLNQVLEGSLPKVKAYDPAPTSSYSNPSNPESEVTFVILGYLESNNNIMLFQVIDAVNTGSSLSINTNTTTLAITVADSTGNNRSENSTYYTVDFGLNTSSKSWTLNFNITLKDGTTGSWVFTKKGVGEDDVRGDAHYG